MSPHNSRKRILVKGYFLDISRWQTGAFTQKVIEQLQGEPKVILPTSVPVNNNLPCQINTHCDRNVPDLSNIASFMECSSVEENYFDEPRNDRSLGERSNSETQLLLALEEESQNLVICEEDHDDTIDERDKIELKLDKMFNFEDDVRKEQPPPAIKTLKKSNKARKNKVTKREDIKGLLIQLFGSTLDDVEFKPKSTTPKKIEKNARRHTLPVSINVTEDLLRPLKVSKKRKSETDANLAVAAKTKKTLYPVRAAISQLVNFEFSTTSLLIKTEMIGETALLSVASDDVAAVTITKPTVCEAESQETISKSEEVIDLTGEEIVFRTEPQSSNLVKEERSKVSEEADTPVRGASMPLLSPVSPAEATSRPEATLPETSTANLSRPVQTQRPPPPYPTTQKTISNKTVKAKIDFVKPSKEAGQRRETQQKKPTYSSQFLAQLGVLEAKKQQNQQIQQTVNYLNPQLQATVSTILNTAQHQVSQLTGFPQKQAQPSVAVAPPSIPVTRASIPVAPPSIPVARASIPVAPPSIPVAPPSIPVTRASISVAPPSISVAPPLIQVAPPLVSVARPSIAVPLSQSSVPAQQPLGTNYSFQHSQTPNSNASQYPAISNAPAVSNASQYSAISNAPALTLLRLFSATHCDFQIISNAACAERLVPHLYIFVQWRDCSRRYFENIKTLLQLKSIEEGNFKAFSAYYDRLTHDFGKKLIKDLQTVDVERFDIRQICYIISMKLQEKSFNINPYNVLITLETLLQLCENDCITPFTKRFYSAIRICMERMEAKAREAHFTVSQLKRLETQIQQYLFIKNWSDAHVSRKNPRVSQADKRQTKRQQQKEKNQTNVVQTLPKQQNNPQRSGRIDSATNVPINPQNYSNSNIPPFTITILNENPTTVPLLQPQVPVQERIATETRMGGNVPVSVVNQNQTTTVPLLQPQVPNHQEQVCSANTTETRKVANGPVSAPKTPPSKESNCQETSVIVYPDKQAPAEVNQEENKPPIVDLTWIDDGDDIEILEEINDCKAFLLRTKNEETDQESSDREVVSPADSGLGSPHIETANDCFKCLCGNNAIYVCACQKSMYCSQDCQVKDWIDHQKWCKQA